MTDRRLSATVHSAGDRRLSLHSAILLYDTDRRLGDAHGEHTVYATIHPIQRPRRGGAILGPGQPATTEACAAFAAAIAERGSFAGFIDPALLYTSPGVTAWWRAPQTERVWFYADGPNGIGNRTAIVTHPGLVFGVSRRGWHVYAVKGDQRPQPDTVIWRAPYFNTWANGTICTGNAERPERVTPQNLHAFERAFFESRFTHPNDPRGLLRYQGGPHKFWRDHLDHAGRDAFPERVLVRQGTHTLATLITGLEMRQ